GSGNTTIGNSAFVTGDGNTVRSGQTTGNGTANNNLVTVRGDNNQLVRAGTALGDRATASNNRATVLRDDNEEVGGGGGIEDSNVGPTTNNNSATVRGNSNEPIVVGQVVRGNDNTANNNSATVRGNTNFLNMGLIDGGDHNVTNDNNVTMN